MNKCAIRLNLFNVYKCIKDSLPITSKESYELFEILVRSFFGNSTYEYNENGAIERKFKQLELTDNVCNSVLADAISILISITTNYLPYFKSYRTECAFKQDEIIITQYGVSLVMDNQRYIEFCSKDTAPF